MKIEPFSCISFTLKVIDFRIHCWLRTKTRRGEWERERERVQVGKLGKSKSFSQFFISFFFLSFLLSCVDSWNKEFRYTYIAIVTMKRAWAWMNTRRAQIISTFIDTQLFYSLDIFHHITWASCFCLPSSLWFFLEKNFWCESWVFSSFWIFFSLLFTRSLLLQKSNHRV